MADYSDPGPLPPEVEAELKAREKAREAARKDRVARYAFQVRKVLDGGSVLMAHELHAVIKAENQPNENEIWEAIRDVTLGNPEYRHGWSRLGKNKDLTGP